MDMIRHATAVFSPGATRGGSMLWRASKRPNLDPDAGFGAEGRENGSKIRRQFVTIHFEASWKLSISIYLEDSG